MDLYAACPRECYLYMPEKMDHNEFQLDEDLIEPFKDFISKLEGHPDEPTDPNDEDPTVYKPKSNSITNTKNFEKRKLKQAQT